MYCSSQSQVEGEFQVIVTAFYLPLDGTRNVICVAKWSNIKYVTHTFILWAWCATRRHWESLDLQICKTTRKGLTNCPSFHRELGGGISWKRERQANYTTLRHNTTDYKPCGNHHHTTMPLSEKEIDRMFVLPSRCVEQSAGQTTDSLSAS